MPEIDGLPKMMGAYMAPYSLRRPGEHRQRLRLAGIGYTVRVGHTGAFTRQLVEVGRLRAADHAGAVLVLENHDHDVVRFRHGRLLFPPDELPRRRLLFLRREGALDCPQLVRGVWRCSVGLFWHCRRN